MADLVTAKLKLVENENVQTIGDIMDHPSTKNCLKCSTSKQNSLKKKSPKDVKIDQIPTDWEVYHETNMIKGIAGNGRNFVVNKVFRK